MDISIIWEYEQEILNVFHIICEQNHLKYVLAYGTLIGAIRHHGFIPWDDDIDVMMPRADYEKLVQIWSKQAPTGYILQDYKNSDVVNNFAKIRKDHTTFLQYEFEKTKKYHKGIFIDIFPGDRVPKNFIGEKVYYIASAVNLLMSRGYTSGSGGIKGLIEKILLSTGENNCRVIRNTTERVMKAWISNDSFPLVFPCTIDCVQKYYEPTMFEERVLAWFNGRQYYIPKDYDSVLHVEYGDYMQLPPENERIWKHHPLIVDFEHNYEELGVENNE